MGLYFGGSVCMIVCGELGFIDFNSFRMRGCVVCLNLLMRWADFIPSYLRCPFFSIIHVILYTCMFAPATQCHLVGDNMIKAKWQYLLFSPKLIQLERYQIFVSFTLFLGWPSWMSNISSRVNTNASYIHRAVIGTYRVRHQNDSERSLTRTALKSIQISRAALVWSPYLVFVVVVRLVVFFPLHHTQY